MNSESYIPGTCNIGKAEIRQRQAIGAIGLIASAILLTKYLLSGAAPQSRLTIFFPLFIASIGFIQARKKFCLAYGFLGTFNFGKLGKAVQISDDAFKREDRRAAFALLVQAVSLSAITTLIVYLLPLK